MVFVMVVVRVAGRCSGGASCDCGDGKGGCGLFCDCGDDSDGGSGGWDWSGL